MKSRGRSGFSKDCNCCRESGYKERTITLRSCYDMDGHKLEEGSQASMQVPGHASRVTCHVSRVTISLLQVTIKEPSGCQCYKCGSALP